MQNESEPDVDEPSAGSLDEVPEDPPEEAPAQIGPIATTYRTARRLIIFVIGATLALIGAVFLFSPMPGAAAVLVVGLGILGLEFEFARRWLVAFRKKYAAAAERFRKRKR